MRDIGEHVEDYAVDDTKRHVKTISRGQLHVGSWDGTVFQWLGYTLDIDNAKQAAEDLFLAIKGARQNFYSP